MLTKATDAQDSRAVLEAVKVEAKNPQVLSLGYGPIRVQPPSTVVSLLRGTSIN